MATLILQHPQGWDWRRVGGWSGSLLAHAIAVAFLALPVDGAHRSAIVPPAATVVTLRDPPPALPPPPPPLPMPVQRLPKPNVRAPAATPAPPPLVQQPSALPEPAPAPPTTPEPTGSAQPAESPAASGGGITQKLAYAQALRPTYPPASVRAREQGHVLLRVLVDVDGNPKTVEIERSSGHARLDAAARDAVRRSRFRPVMQDGTAVSAWGLVPIEFRLGEG